MMAVASYLWSLNERAAGRPGLDLPALSLDWQEDLCRYAIEQSERLEEQLQESERELRQARGRY